MSDAIDRLARIKRHKMRSAQARLQGVADEISSADARDASLRTELEEARASVSTQPRLGPELDRFEKATNTERERLSQVRADAEARYHEIEDEVYETFRSMKTFEKLSDERARRARARAERQEAERRDELTIARSYRKRRTGSRKI